LAKKAGEQQVKFYFDQSSGLLLRVMRYQETPLGPLPLRVDYSDYRNADGVQVPFRRIVARADSTATIQWQQVQQNIAIDNARFSKPSGTEANRKSPI
jgi:hypothetical protein